MNVSPRPYDRRLPRVTLGFAFFWALTAIANLALWIPTWLAAVVALVSVPLGFVWMRWARQPGIPKIYLAIVVSAAYPGWWHAVVATSEWMGLTSIHSGLVSMGLFGLFSMGLGWIVWGLERSSRRFDLQRINAAIATGASSLPHHHQPRNFGPRVWHPADSNAWYYGLHSRKLKQSTLTVVSYAALFWFVTLALSQLPGCQLIYELPAGGGKQQALTQKVRIEKVVRKKYVVNPYSSIKFEVPPIDEVKLKLQEITAHQYTIGYGEGTGAGFAGGTSKGRVRLIRLEYDGGDWDLNFGVGGDANMLLEYGILTQQPVAEKSESLRVSQLASFPKDKSPPVVFLTGQQNLFLSNSEVKTLREYLRDKHGMLFASSGSGHFHNQFMALMNRVLPEIPPVSVPLDDGIHRIPFNIPSLPYVVPHGGKDALGWSADGRWLVYYHPGDISDAWADGHAGVSREIYDACFQLGVNVLNYAHVEYSKRLQTKVLGK